MFLIFFPFSGSSADFFKLIMSPLWQTSVTFHTSWKELLMSRTSRLQSSIILSLFPSPGVYVMGENLAFLKSLFEMSHHSKQQREKCMPCSMNIFKVWFLSMTAKAFFVLAALYFLFKE